MKQKYGQFCPVALASEVLAERWTLLVVRELLAGSRRFSDIRRGIPRISATLLKQRLIVLEDAGILERRSSNATPGFAYCLTKAGQELRPLLDHIGEWGQRWARDIKPDDLDPGWLVWNIHRRLNTPAMPSGRTVIEINFLDASQEQRLFWIVHLRGKAEVCVRHPGFEVDLQVSAKVKTLAEVWRGIRSMRMEIRARNIRLSGSSSARRNFPEWLLLSKYASVRKPRTA